LSEESEVRLVFTADTLFVGVLPDAAGHLPGSLTIKYSHMLELLR
jgi:hypothetical protein